MKIRVERDALRDVVERCQRAIRGASFLPALDHLHLVAEDERLTVHATDQSLAIVARCDADIEEPGERLLPAKRMAALLRAMPGDTITMAPYGAHGTRLRCGGGRWHLNAVPVDEFPPMPEMGDTPWEVDGQALLRMTRMVEYAANESYGQYFTSVVMIHQDADAVDVVALESRRIAWVRRPYDDAMPCPDTLGDILLPVADVRLLPAVFQGATRLRIDRQDNMVVVEDTSALHTTMGIRQVDGEFPTYAQLYPADSPVILHVDAQELRQVLRRVMLFANPKTASVVLVAMPDCLSVGADTADFGKAIETLPCEYQGDKPYVCGLRASFLIDIIAALPQGSITLRAPHPLYAQEIGPVEPLPDNQITRHLVMPVRIEGPDVALAQEQAAAVMGDDIKATIQEMVQDAEQNHADRRHTQREAAEAEREAEGEQDAREADADDEASPDSEGYPGE